MATIALRLVTRIADRYEVEWVDTQGATQRSPITAQMYADLAQRNAGPPNVVPAGLWWVARAIAQYDTGTGLVPGDVVVDQTKTGIIGWVIRLRPTPLPNLQDTLFISTGLGDSITIALGRPQNVTPSGGIFPVKSGVTSIQGGTLTVI